MIKILIFFYLFVINISIAFALEIDHEIVFEEGENRFVIGPPYEKRFIDKSETPIIDVLKTPWLTPDSPVFNNGYQPGVGWSIVRIRNVTNQPKNIVFYFQKASSEIELFSLRNGQLYPLGSATQNISSNSLMSSRMAAVEVVLDAHGSLDCVVKLQSVPLNGSLFVKTKKAYQADRYNDDLFLLFILGLLFFNSLCNFLLYFIIKDNIYLICATYSFVFFIYQFIEKNITKIIFPTTIDLKTFNDHYISIFSTLVTMTGALLCRKFLRIPEKVKIFNISASILVLSGVLLCVSNFFPYSPFQKRMFSAQFGLAANTLIIIMFIYTLRYKTRESFIFFVSYIPIIGATVLFLFSRYGIINFPSISDNLLIIGGVFNVIFLTIGFADRINQLKLEKEKLEIERLRELGKIAVQVGDSLNTPLNVISLCIEEIQEIDDSSQYTQECLNIMEQVSMINKKCEPLKKYRTFSKISDLS